MIASTEILSMWSMFILMKDVSPNQAAFKNIQDWGGYDIFKNTLSSHKSELQCDTIIILSYVFH